jgi:hypothetical protein
VSVSLSVSVRVRKRESVCVGYECKSVMCVGGNKNKAHPGRVGFKVSKE